MNEKDLSKLQKAANLIKAQDYKGARAILVTMPKNQKAVQWLLKLDEKEMFDTPAPASASSSANRPQKAKSASVGASRKFNPVKMVLMLLGVVVVMGATTAIVFEITNRQRALEMLPEATQTMATFCRQVWEPSRCDTYATKFFEQDINRVFRVNLCSAYPSVEGFVNCMGSDLKLPSEVGA